MSARDLLGIDPDFTGGMETTAYVRHGRGECDGVPCVMCDLDEAREDLRRAVALLAEPRDDEVRRLRHALRTIQGWDMLNPPQGQVVADLPWLRRLVDAALDGAS